jgi:hypothetical protein
MFDAAHTGPIIARHAVFMADIGYHADQAETIDRKGNRCRMNSRQTRSKTAFWRP